MLFNRKPDHSSNFVLAGGHMPASLPTTDHALAALRAPSGPAHQSGTATQSVIDSWLTITGTLESNGDILSQRKRCKTCRLAFIVISD